MSAPRPNRRRGMRLRLRRKSSDSDVSEFTVAPSAKLTAQQIAVLEGCRSRSGSVSARTILRLATQLHVDVEKIRNWFENQASEKNNSRAQSSQSPTRRSKRTRHMHSDPIEFVDVTGPPYRIRLRRCHKAAEGTFSNRNRRSARVIDVRKESGTSLSPTKRSRASASESDTDSDAAADAQKKLDQSSVDAIDESVEVDEVDTHQAEFDSGGDDIVDNDDASRQRMTARQRSLAGLDEDEDEDDNVELETEPVDEVILTEEMELRKSELARRRRLTQERQEEEAKQDTIDRLLKKTSTRKAKADRKNQKRSQRKGAARAQRRQEQEMQSDTVRYRSFVHRAGSHNGVRCHVMSTLTFPAGHNIPAMLNNPPCPVACTPTPCAAPGCSNPHRYSCSTSHLPICSLPCYKALRNTVQFRQAVHST